MAPAAKGGKNMVKFRWSVGTNQQKSIKKGPDSWLLPRFKTSNFSSFPRDSGMVPTRKIGENQVVSRARPQLKIKNACLKVGCCRDLAAANSPGFRRFQGCTLRKNERRSRWSVWHDIKNDECDSLTGGATVF